jgi:hypothetical protein
VGSNALRANTTGRDNTALGRDTLLAVQKGTGNTAIGWGAGANLQDGRDNIYMGHPGAASESNTLRLGSDLQTRTFIAGVTGNAVTGNTVRITAEGRLGVLLSSARYKQDIQPIGPYSEKVRQLRPVTFRYKDAPTGPPQYGLIAEEVAEIYPELVTRSAEGDIEGVRYEELMPMLLNELQLQHKQLQAFSQQLAELKAQNESLRATMEKMQEQKAAFSNSR